MILKTFKFFLFTAYKPWESLFEALEEIMRMEKIMNSESKYWNINNKKIPAWFYQMLFSMGISVCLGFYLILAGSL